MTKEEKAELINVLREFVLRVASDTDNKKPVEIAILPAIAKLIFDNSYTFTFTGANLQSKEQT